jgi:hypothetical protein
MEGFQQVALQTAKGEIAQLKNQLADRISHEIHIEQELMQQEHNVQVFLAAYFFFFSVYFFPFNC